MNVRLSAYECLKNIVIQGAFSNLEVQRVLASTAFSDADRRLFTTLVYGTVQHYHLFNSLFDQRFTNEKVTITLRVLFALTWYQLHYLDRVPSYAIGNETTLIARHVFGDSKAKFVNAITRQLVDLTPHHLFSDEQALLMHPQWLIKMVQAQWPQEAQRIMNHDVAPTSEHLRINPLHPRAEEVVTALQLEKGRLSPHAYRYHGSLFLPLTEWFKDGVISYQDEASQWVVSTLAPQSTDRILDLCAAPGSKSSQLAELSDNQAHIISVDLYPQRVKLIEENKERLKLSSIQAISADGTQANATLLGGKFDKILLDAPCSGLGVIRRKPDILLKSTGNYMDELLVLQSALLDNAANLLFDGGLLLYSTCTWNKKENQRQVDAFLKRHPEFEKIEETQLFGDEYDTDAFYKALMRKRSL